MDRKFARAVELAFKNGTESRQPVATDDADPTRPR
jgi:hypothetical protein